MYSLLKNLIQFTLQEKGKNDVVYLKCSAPKNISVTAWQIFYSILTEWVPSWIHLLPVSCNVWGLTLIENKFSKSWIKTGGEFRWWWEGISLIKMRKTHHLFWFELSSMILNYWCRVVPLKTCCFSMNTSYPYELTDPYFIIEYKYFI